MFAKEHHWSARFFIQMISLAFLVILTSDIVHRGCHDVLGGQGFFKKAQKRSKTWSKIGYVFVQFVNELVQKLNAADFWSCPHLRGQSCRLMSTMKAENKLRSEIFLTWFSFVSVCKYLKLDVSFSHFLCSSRNITFQWKLAQLVHEGLGQLV